MARCCVRNRPRACWTGYGSTTALVRTRGVWPLAKISLVQRSRPHHSPAEFEEHRTISDDHLHVLAKYTFVRILRHSAHLQRSSVTHWSVWLGCTFALATVGFLIASAVPTFSFLIALAGSLCFAPLSLVLPGCFWWFGHHQYQAGPVLYGGAYWLHWLLILVGALVTVAGTYGFSWRSRLRMLLGRLMGRSCVLIMVVPLEHLAWGSSQKRFGKLSDRGSDLPRTDPPRPCYQIEDRSVVCTGWTLLSRLQDNILIQE